MINNLLTRTIIFTALSGFLSLSGCAVMDKSTPGWSQYRNLDRVNELQLASSSVGKGDPVLLIHGFGASSYSWRYVIEPLAQKYRVITIDLKGFGESPKPRDDQYSVYEQARLVRNFILENKLENLSIHIAPGSAKKPDINGQHCLSARSSKFRKNIGYPDTGITYHLRYS